MTTGDKGVALLWGDSRGRKRVQRDLERWERLTFTEHFLSPL